MAPDTERRAKSAKPRKMGCDKHYRPSNILEEPHSESDDMPRPPKRYHRKLAPGDKRGSCICDYYDFPHLLEERLEFDAKYKTLKETFPFLKLPAEIRNQIYEELFIADQPIEFCPEPFFFHGYDHNAKAQSGWQKDFNRNVTYHREWKKENISGYVSFLRVNKQICAEATPYLYSENEFRFSNMTGWVALDFFLFAIGLEKVAMLRKIAVNHPDTIYLPRYRAKLPSFSKGSLYIKLYETNEPGFVYEKRWFKSNISMDPALVLQKAGKLRQLHLISPAKSRLLVIDSPINLACFAELDFTLVSLRSEKHNINVMPFTLKRADAARQMADGHFEKTGEQWKYLDKVIDGKGLY